MHRHDHLCTHIPLGAIGLKVLLAINPLGTVHHGIVGNKHSVYKIQTVCMCAFMHVHMYVCMYVLMCACMYVHVGIYACVYVRMYVCSCVRVLCVLVNANAYLYRYVYTRVVQV